MFIEQLTHLFAPWQSLYSDSRILPAATESLHLLALLFGGGLAISADRATLRVARRGDAERAAQLSELHAVHRPVLIALAGSFITGLALATADIATFAASPAFWIKLSLVALLLGNGALLSRTETQLRGVAPTTDTGARAARLWARLRFNSICSVALWSATLVAGAVLVNVA